MKKSIQIIAFLAGCALVIALAINAGEHHDNCGECELAMTARN